MSLHFVNTGVEVSDLYKTPHLLWSQWTFKYIDILALRANSYAHMHERKGHVTLHCLQWMNTESVILLFVYIFQFPSNDLWIQLTAKDSVTVFQALKKKKKGHMFQRCKFPVHLKKAGEKVERYNFRKASSGVHTLLDPREPSLPSECVSVDCTSAGRSLWKQAGLLRSGVHRTVCLIGTALLPVWDSYKYDH